MDNESDSTSRKTTQLGLVIPYHGLLGPLGPEALARASCPSDPLGTGPSGPSGSGLGLLGPEGSTRKGA